MNAPSRETFPQAVTEKTDMQLVVFSLAGCELAVEIQKVREIIRVAEITMMPKAPAYLEGIINLRGRIFPVLDFKKRFDMPRVDRTEETRILVVENQDQVLGLLVDKVVEVLKTPPASVEPVREPLLTISPDFILGKVTPQGRLILLLNLEKAFNLEDLKNLPDLDSTSQREGKPLGH